MSREPVGLDTEEAEEALVSILMANPGMLDSIPELVPEHFSHELMRAIYVQILHQSVDGRGCDPVTIFNALNGVIELEDVLRIYSAHTTPSSLRRLTKQIIDKYLARQLQRASQTVNELAYDDGPIADRIDRAQACVAGLVSTDSENDWIDAYEAALGHSEVIEARDSDRPTGIGTGLQDLDEMLDGGMRPGNLVIVGARPSMGKTAIALCIAQHAARDYPTLFLSMEMTVAEVSDRSFALLGHEKLSHIKRPKLGLDYQNITDALEQMRGRNLKISQKSGLNILQVKRMARAAKRKFGMRLLVVDYVGLMPGIDTRQPRAYQIEEITRGLKELAKELDIPIICLAQVNRAAAEKVHQVPGLADIRDSGAIEQDADVVCFIHRPIMANPALEPIWKDYAVLRIAKNRQGRCGDIHLHYAGEQTRFSAWDGEAPRAQSASTGRGFGK